MFRDGWIEALDWLTKYTNKESTFHNMLLLYTFHTTILLWARGSVAHM